MMGILAAGCSVSVPPSFSLSRWYFYASSLHPVYTGVCLLCFNYCLDSGHVLNPPWCVPPWPQAHRYLKAWRRPREENLWSFCAANWQCIGCRVARAKFEKKVDLDLICLSLLEELTEMPEMHHLSSETNKFVPAASFSCRCVKLECRSGVRLMYLLLLHKGTFSAKPILCCIKLSASCMMKAFKAAGVIDAAFIDIEGLIFYLNLEWGTSNALQFIARLQI